MRHWLVISYAYDWRSGLICERSICAKTRDDAEALADAQYLGGEELVKIRDPKGQTEIHHYRKEVADA